MPRFYNDPMDGKGDRRYSKKVASATRSVESHDVNDFNRDGGPVSVIANYARLGEALRRNKTFVEVAKQISGIAEMAEAAVMQEAGDWFDANTIKRNMKELKGHAGSFTKLCQEMDSMQQRATALYDDMGNVLTRYFEISGPKDEEPFGDATDTSEPDGARPGASFGGKKAPEFDGPGGNPADDRGRKSWDMRDGEEDDSDEDMNELVERITNSVMNRIIPESKTLREAKDETNILKAKGAIPSGYDRASWDWRIHSKGSYWKSTPSRGTSLKKPGWGARAKSGEVDYFPEESKAMEFANWSNPNTMPGSYVRGNFAKGQKESIIPERGEPTPQRARKALRTPKAFAKAHQGLSHDMAKSILKKESVKTVKKARTRLHEASRSKGRRNSR